LDKKQIFIGIAMLSLFNGMFSPFVPLVIGISPFWLPEWIEGSFAIVLYLAVLIMAFTTMLVAGVPAAVYERMTGAQGSTERSMYIWLGATALLSLPAVSVAASLFG
jgi:hypothetical protein